jgi:hypothetical protein
MEHYPEITRRDGTLFFECPETSRAAIATSIERLIDLLDALDDDPDLEPYLADYSGQGDDREGDDSDLEPSCGWVACEAAYASYGQGQGVHEEEEEPSGFGDVEGMLEDMTGEPELGWTAKTDQSLPHLHQTVWVEDGEPSLGWCGQGIGFRAGEDLSDNEANGDERDFSGYPDELPGPAGANCDGSGVVIARDMIRGLPIAATRAEAYMAVGVTPLVYHFTAKPFSYANIW